jgi:replicative DNA helicase
VIFIFREEVYAKEAKKEEMRGRAEVIIGKHRNGPTGTAKLFFDSELTRFRSLEAQREEYFPE